MKSETLLTFLSLVNTFYEESLNYSTIPHRISDLAKKLYFLSTSWYDKKAMRDGCSTIDIFMKESVAMQEMTHRHTRELDIFYNENKSNCTNCGRPFSDGMYAHLGYLPNQVAAVCCDDCASNLVETVVCYYWIHDEYEKPNPQDKLWRYMDLGKFIHIISSKKMYFPSADSFEDSFEGAKGTVKRKTQWDEFYFDFLKEAIVSVPDASPEMLEPENVKKAAKRLLFEMEKSGEWSRQHTFINCWHCNEFESEAMWKLYSVNTQNAVAIQTTAAHLYESLDRNPQIAIGKVKYIDFNKRFASINGAYWYKRKSFEHEREVRAVLSDYTNKSKGVLIPIDINTLIDSVYISPYAPKWFNEVVCSIIEKYEISCQIICSEMLERPFF